MGARRDNALLAHRLRRRPCHYAKRSTNSIIRGDVANDAFGCFAVFGAVETPSAPAPARDSSGWHIRSKVARAPSPGSGARCKRGLVHCDCRRLTQGWLAALASRAAHGALRSRFDMTDGVAGGLAAKGIIYRSSNVINHRCRRCDFVGGDSQACTASQSLTASSTQAAFGARKGAGQSGRTSALPSVAH